MSKITKQFKTSVGECKLFIDAEAGKVVALITDKERFGKQYKGIASCNFEEGDTFDLEFGEKLAVNRALNEAFYQIADMREAAVEFYEKQIELMSDRMFKASVSYERAAAQCNKYAYVIDELIEEKFHKE